MKTELSSLAFATISCTWLALPIACGSSTGAISGASMDAGLRGAQPAEGGQNGLDVVADAPGPDGTSNQVGGPVSADSGQETGGDDSSVDAAMDVLPVNMFEAGPHCGNGTLDPGEQCDDGNRFNLDGCDSTCRYEVVTRMTSLSIESTAAPSFCTPATNRIGTQSFTSAALGQINPSVQTGIDDGTTDVFAQILGLDNPSGSMDATGLAVGVYNGAIDPGRGTWPGKAPIDWWFLADHRTLAPGGAPASSLASGALAGGKLTAGPSDVLLPLPLGGVLALLHVRNAHLSASIGATPAPNLPAPPPSTLATGFTVFQTASASGNGQGLCGNMTVESLAQVPIPDALTTGSTACSAQCSGSHSYTSCAGSPVGAGCNSVLDALVGGCQVAPLCGPLAVIINAQQPDVAAAGSVRTLTLGASNKVPSSQTTGNNDAYSVYLKFDLNRAHFTGQECAQTSDCQTGKTCVNAVCQ